MKDIASARLWDWKMAVAFNGSHCHHFCDAIFLFMKIINQGLGFEGTRKTILSNYSLHQHATQEVSILFSVLPHPNPASISPTGTSGIGTVFITGGKKREKNLLSWSRNEIWNEMSWKRERLKRKRKKSPSKESIPGDKPALDLWRAGRASKQHLIMGFQAGFHKMSLAAPCRKPVAIVALLSDANKGMINCDAAAPMQCVHITWKEAIMPLWFPWKCLLCLYHLLWLLRNARCTAKIQQWDNAFIFELKVYRIQSEPARWICIPQRLVWQDKKENQCTVRNRKEAERQRDKHTGSDGTPSPKSNPVGRFSWVYVFESQRWGKKIN